MNIMPDKIIIIIIIVIIIIVIIIINGWHKFEEYDLFL